MSHLLTIVSFLFLVQPAVHDIHISISEIEITDHQVELVLKTFIDDLQQAVGLEPGAELSEDYTSSDELIARYLSKSIHLYANDTPLTPTIDDISASPDAVWITILYDRADLNTIKKIDLTTTFLTEIYDDQTNLIKVASEQGLTTKLLNKKNTSVNIDL